MSLPGSGRLRHVFASIAVAGGVLAFAHGPFATALAAPPRLDDPKGGALAGERMRVIIATDAGRGDHDDQQSLVHFLLYADLFDVEGFIATTGNGGTGTTTAIKEAIDAYAKDYQRLLTYSVRYPEPEHLKSLVVMGDHEKAPSAGFRQPTDGSRLIIAAAKRNDPRPLYICFWGGITDLARAVHDEPSIKPKVRGLSIGPVRQDKRAGQYLISEHEELWLVRITDSNKGMWFGGYQEGDYSNSGFVKAHIQGHGALGDYYWNLRKQKDGMYPRRIREGDTASFLYLLRGDPDDPTGEHWGGQYEKAAARQWIDLQDLSYSGENNSGQVFYGVKTVNKWRVNVLDEFAKRMDRAARENPNAPNPNAVDPPVDASVVDDGFVDASVQDSGSHDSEPELSVDDAPGHRGTSPILTRTPVLARMQVIPLVNRPPVVCRLTAMGASISSFCSPWDYCVA